MLTAKEIISLLKHDIDLHKEMELANENPDYGYYANRLTELVELLENETQHPRLAAIVREQESN